MSYENNVFSLIKVYPLYSSIEGNPKSYRKQIRDFLRSSLEVSLAFKKLSFLFCFAFLELLFLLCGLCFSYDLLGSQYDICLPLFPLTLQIFLGDVKKAH